MTVSSLERFRGRLRIYSRTILWLVREVVSNFKWPTLRVVVSGLIGIFGQGLGLLIIFSFARSLETGQPPSLRGFVFPLEPSYENLLIVAAGVFVLMVISAICQFDAQRQALSIACRFEEFLVRRTFVAASRVPLSAPSSEQINDSGHLRKLATRDAKIASRIVFLLISNLIDLCFFLAFLAFVLWLDWLTTSVVFVLMTLYGGGLYWLNIYGVHSSRSMERSIGPSAAEKRKIVTRLLRSTVPIAFDDPDVEYIFRSGNTAKALQSYERRLAVIPIGALISSAFTAFVICAVLALFGAVIFFEAGSWSRLLAYVLALRLVLRRLAKLASGATSISRLYPSARRFYDFLTSIEGANIRAAQLPMRQVRLPIPPLHRNEDRSVGIEIAPGQPVLVLSSTSLSRSHANTILTCAPGMAGVESALVTIPKSLRPVPLRTFLPLASQDDWPTLFRDLSALGFTEDDQRRLTSGLNTLIGGKADTVPSSVQFAAIALASLRAGAQIFFLEAESLYSLAEPVRRSLLASIQDRVIFFHLVAEDTVPEIPFAGNAIMMPNSQIIGWAPFAWLREHPQKLSRKTEKLSLGADVEDDLDELMYE